MTGGRGISFDLVSNQTVFECAHFLMPVIARFNHVSEAAFFQTLLDEKGIPSALLDSGSTTLGISNIAHACIEVPEEHVARAVAVHEDYAKDNEMRADKIEQTHPNKGFPFFAVWVMATLSIWLVLGIVAFGVVGVEDGVLPVVMEDVVFGIFGGLFIAAGIAFWRVVLIYVARRFRG